LLFSIPVILYFKVVSSAGFAYIIASFIACMIQSMDVYSIFYDAQLKSLINVIMNLFGLTISILIRGAIPLFEINPVYLSIPIVIAPLLPYMLRLYYFSRNQPKQKLSFRKKFRYNKYLIFSGFNFAISSVSVAIYTRMAIFFLGAMNGNSVVAIFTVAATLAGSWSFVLYSFITSSLPNIFKEKEKKLADSKVINLYWLVVIISSVVILTTFSISKYFIFYFYGAEFLSSYTPLVILSFSTLFGALGTITARYIAKYSGYSYLSKKTIIVCFFSIGISYLLIKYYGVIGAAFATVLIELFSLTIANYFYRKKLILNLHIEFLFYPIYFIKKLREKNENPPHRR